MSNYATINLTNELARLPGVGSVKVFGAGDIFDADLDGSRASSIPIGLVPKDVIDAIRQQSQNVAAGQVGMPPAPPDQQFQYTCRYPVAIRTIRGSSATSSSRTRPRRAAA